MATSILARQKPPQYCLDDQVRQAITSQSPRSLQEQNNLREIEQQRQKFIGLHGHDGLHLPEKQCT